MQAMKPKPPIRQVFATIGTQTCLYRWTAGNLELVLWRISRDAADPRHPLTDDAAAFLHGFIVGGGCDG